MNDPLLRHSYVFATQDAQAPFSRSATSCFRCAKYGSPLPANLTSAITILAREARSLAPCRPGLVAVQAACDSRTIRGQFAATLVRTNSCKGASARQSDGNRPGRARKRATSRTRDRADKLDFEAVRNRCGGGPCGVRAVAPRDATVTQSLAMVSRRVCATVYLNSRYSNAEPWKLRVRRWNVAGTPLVIVAFWRFLVVAEFFPHACSAKSWSLTMFCSTGSPHRSESSHSVL